MMDKNKKLFPQRLWELIHDEKYNFCLRWSSDGQRVYLNRSEFESHYLKTPNNQFHTQKAISFVRQMNMYGFRKVDDCFYENDHFKQNCPHLLKNMVRRHSNKGFFSPPNNDNHLHNQVRNQQQHYQQQQAHQHDRSISNSNQSNYHARDNGASSARQRSAIPDTERQPLQCYRDLGGDGISSIGNLGAAMAVINANASQSPLASTLYHRLAALNFGQANNKIQLLQQQTRSSAPSIASLTLESQNQHMNGGSQPQLQSQQQSHRRSSVQFEPQFQNDIPINSNQPFMAHQVVQQNLFRSLLQLKQPHTPMSIQQSILTNFQHSNPNLSIGSLAGLCPASSGSQVEQSDMSPLELVVNPTGSSSSSDHDQNSQCARYTIDNNSCLRMAERSNMIGLNRDLFDNQIDDEDELDNNDCAIDFEDETFDGNDNCLAGGLTTYSNLESLSYPQDSEDINDSVLDLVKPSSTRSIGRQTTEYN